MKFKDLLRDIYVLENEGNAEIRDIVIDSRKVRPGSCFVPLRGGKVNGHTFIEGAIRDGAVAIIAERLPKDYEGSFAYVEDTRQSLGDISANFFGHPSKELKVVGVTGTNGKTTTSHIIAHILRWAEKTTGIIGTTGIHWPGKKIVTPNTTPESLVLQRTLREMVDDGVENLCMEVSSHGLETGRLNGLLFDVGVFLNLTQDHLDFHGNMESYFQAKLAFFTKHLSISKLAGKQSKAVISIDDPYGERISKQIDEVVSFGITGGDYHATEIVSDLKGTHFKLSYPQGKIEVSTNLIGAFNVSNILASIAACVQIGVSVERSIIALANGGHVNVDGRLERVIAKASSHAPDGSSKGNKHVFVDYAHTPDALENVLQTLRDIVNEKKIWLVFGAGGDRDIQKRSMMGRIALKYADEIIVTNDNPRTEDPKQIIQDIIADNVNKFRIEMDRKLAIEKAIFQSEIGDVVLIAGKGHEEYQELAEGKIAFSDRKEAARALELSLSSVSKEKGHA